MQFSYTLSKGYKHAFSIHVLSLLLIIVAIVCLNLSNVENGVIIYSSSTAPWPHGTNATYQCDEGFGLDGGDDIRTCGGDSNNYIGYWTGTALNCLGMLISFIMCACSCI